MDLHSIKKYLMVFTLVAAPLFAAAAPVDINTADVATLADSIKGVGQAKAKAIVAYREKNGPFKSVEDLSLVKGIGEKIVEVNRDNLTIGSPTTSKK